MDWLAYEEEYNNELTHIWNSIPTIISDPHLHKTYLAGAIAQNDLEHLHLLLEIGKGIELLDDDNETLIHFAVKKDNVDALNCLLHFKDAPINAENSFEETPLIIATRERQEQCTLKLIEMGADLTLVDLAQVSALHYAVGNGLMTVARALIERGIDINGRNDYGATPLFWACSSGKVEAVHMLLYYGADAAIPTITGYTPFHVAGTAPGNIQEILFDYLYDEEKVAMRLCTLVNAMASNSPLLPRLFDIVCEVHWNMSDLDMLCDTVPILNPRHFKTFVEKFDYVIKPVLKNGSLMEQIVFGVTEEGINNLTTLCENDEFVYYLVKGVNKRLKLFYQNDPTLGHPEWYCFTIGLIGGVLEEVEASQQEATMQILLCLVAHGILVTAYDLCVVYEKFGYCPLFQDMLEMDIGTAPEAKKLSLMPMLIYYPYLNIEEFFINSVKFSKDSLHLVLEYFAHPKLKEFCLNSGNNFLISEAQKFPDVPLLLELARNAIRQCVVDKHNIKKFSQYRQIVERLPITDACKAILVFKRKLYP